jgi:hypothetical protein
MKDFVLAMQCYWRLQGMCGFCNRRSFLTYTTAGFAGAVMGKAGLAEQKPRGELDKPNILNNAYLKETDKPSHFSSSYKRQSEPIAHNIRAVGYSEDSRSGCSRVLVTW